MICPDEPDFPLRIAVVSTPRTGTNWLRALLRNLYGLSEFAVHNVRDVIWDNLPKRCLLGIHWHPTDEFVGLLKQHGFRVVTLSRHPLDTLISILRFAPLCDETARWLEGEGGDESAIHDACPVDRRFLDYACGPRASALFSVSVEWAGHPMAFLVSYERLVENTAETLAELVEWIGYRPMHSVDTVVDMSSKKSMRNWSGMHVTHVWLGQPGAWKQFVTADVADAVVAAHSDTFRMFDYQVDARSNLDSAQAKIAWYEMVARTAVRDVRQLRELQRATALRCADFAVMQDHLKVATQEQARQAETIAQLRCDRDALQVERDSLRESTHLLRELGQGPIACAVIVHRMRNTFPWATAIPVRLLRTLKPILGQKALSHSGSLRQSDDRTADKWQRAA